MYGILCSYWFCDNVSFFVLDRQSTLRGRKYWALFFRHLSRIDMSDLISRWVVLFIFPNANPFKLNGISHSYQMDQSIFILRLLGCTFIFYLNFHRSCTQQTVEILIRRRVLWRLGLHDHKKDARRIWVIKHFLAQGNSKDPDQTPIS